MPKKVKLIRDGLEPKDPDSPANVSLHDCSKHPSFPALLVAKLYEEVGEVAQDLQDPSEYADVLEALMCLAEVSGVKWSDVLDRAKSKRVQRGGLRGGKLMVVLDGSPKTPGVEDESDKARLPAPPETVLVWTDGSCAPNPGPGGWAFRMKDSGGRIVERHGRVGYTTNNRMELRAVYEAVEHVEAFCPGRHVRLVVHTDSELVIGWMTKRMRRTNETAREMCREIETLASSRGVELEFKKVKAHSGHWENDRVDRLASGR